MNFSIFLLSKKPDFILLVIRSVGGYIPSECVFVKEIEDGKFEMIDGHHRLLAWRSIQNELPEEEQIKTIPARVGSNDF